MKCLNWLICHNDAKRGHSLCAPCIEQAIKMDDPIYIPPPESDRERERRMKANDQRERSTAK